MRWLFAIVIGGFLLCAAQAETLAPKAFTEAFAKRLEAARQGSTVTVKGDLAIQIKDADGRTLEMSLANFYAGYRSDPNDLEELSRKYLAGIPPPGAASTKKDERLDRTRIVPVIKDAARKGLAQMWAEGPSGSHYQIMTGKYGQVGCGIYASGSEVNVSQDFR